MMPPQFNIHTPGADPEKNREEAFASKAQGRLQDREFVNEITLIY